MCWVKSAPSVSIVEGGVMGLGGLDNVQSKAALSLEKKLPHAQA